VLTRFFTHWLCISGEINILSPGGYKVKSGHNRTEEEFICQEERKDSNGDYNSSMSLAISYSCHCERSAAISGSCHCEQPKGVWQSHIPAIANGVKQSQKKKCIFLKGIATLRSQ
jgi:hypothetical protein